MKMGNVERLTFLTDMVGEQPELRVEAATLYERTRCASPRSRFAYHVLPKHVSASKILR